MLDTELPAARYPRRQRNKAERKSSSIPPLPPSSCVSITERSAGDFGILAPDFVDKTMGVLRASPTRTRTREEIWRSLSRSRQTFPLSLSLSPPSLSLAVSPFFRVSSIKPSFFFFSIKEEGEIEINRGLIIKSGY